MRDPSFGRWEEYVRDTARDLRYPPTPNLCDRRGRAAAMARKRVVVSVAVLLLALAILLSLPPVGAAVLRVLHIGSERIVTTSEPPRAARPFGRGTVHVSRSTATAKGPSGSFNATAVRSSTSVIGLSVSPPPAQIATTSLGGLRGRTTLSRVRREVGFPISLPGYPADLGNPDRVYLEDFGGKVIVLVWTKANSPEPQLVLYEFGPDVMAEKLMPPQVKVTSVGGHKAVWARAPHLLFFLANGAPSGKREVESNTLVWSSGSVTYRLESRYGLREARRIAASLHPPSR